MPSGKAVEQLARDRTTNAVGLIGEMARLCAAGTLPARIEESPARLIVYTQRHAATLYVSDHGDAYRLGHVARLTFKDQERLLRGALTLMGVAGWRAFEHVRDVPPGWSAQWPAIAREWSLLDAQRAVASAHPPHHAAYLDLLTEVVEATRDIEIERQRTAPPAQYARKRSTREERHSGRGVYTFTLVRPARLTVGAPVFIADEPNLRGRIVRVDGLDVVVRFDSAVDYRSIPDQGGLHELPSDRVHKAQLDAIETLRQGRAVNPQLLAELVDRRLRPFSPAAVAPREPLDPGQLSAFRSALRVPDQLLVLGPPGTGKTRTIIEIAAGSVAVGERVLVTSHTNRAVDNVLERLPGHLRAVRVGNEDSMTSQARTFMVEAQVQGLRDEILAATEGTASRLSAFADAQPPGSASSAPAVRWLEFLGAQVDEARAADARAQTAAAAGDAARQRAIAPIAAQLAMAGAALQRVRADLAGAERHLAAARRRFAAADARASRGLLAFFFRWLAARRWRSAQAAEATAGSVRAAAGQAEAAHVGLLAQADALAWRDPETARQAAARDAAAVERRAALEQARRAAEVIRDCLRPVPAAPGLPPAPEADDLAGWEQHRRLTAEAVTAVRSRAGLLAEWRDRVRDADEELQRELVRYADVVVATCVGTATTALLAELEFDLAVVDEAGQISTPNLLVPLVRAKRSVLVGDHHQLPPYLDDEVKGWMESLRGGAAEQVADLLRRSAFERLYLSADDQHRVMLTIQRRMPEPLARFVSDRFYSGVLTTEHPGGPSDSVFRAPFAMVDTADQPVARRAERPGRRQEEWGRGGYINPFEADLITLLITWYVDQYPDWAVIVPYRAQVELVTEQLTKALGDAAVIADNVGTVDAFQGGERDLIVYGFTRSNKQGDIGFLKELRRINVAITRARRQLVLVGDGSTLRAARDRPFAELMLALTDHLTHSGDLRPSREVQQQLEGLL
ncbi:DEAD/DEAH box helicase [Dactylosporangium sp. NPDC048998]|uniref:DEAD/DEAH box helicase n=1 Tax=Dactylosporangium sp. NPDC048998 TaxID=3363976 RepID=UPI00371A9467